MLHWLNTNSGLAQWVSLIPIIGGLTALWRHRNCSVPGCARLARHGVPGTTYRVCARHHTRDEHQALQRRHEARHPDRLAA